jgi:integrase
VFTTAEGRPVSRTWLSAKVWRPALKAARVGAKFHDLRHFYASLPIFHGESPKVVQARLGHASITETMDTYSHLWPDSDDRTREAVDTILAAGPADSLRTGRSS